MSQQLQYYVFAVNTTPYCVWGWDLKERNDEFIQHIDGGYFLWQAKLYAQSSTGEASRAALAIRTTYHHALETFFTLLCATIQARACVAAWILKSDTRRLRTLVGAIQKGSTSVPNIWRMNHVTWQAVSEKINCFAYDAERLSATRALFARLWANLAHDYLDSDNIDEYNSIKHGLRVGRGGFTLAAGIEEEPGKAAPPEAMQVIGGSEHGSSFFTASPIEKAKRTRADPHLYLQQRFLNWNPASVVHAVQLVSLSLGNVVSYLRIINGADPKSVQFSRPEDSTFFDAPWASSVGLKSLSMDLPVKESDIRRYSKAEMRRHLAGDDRLV